MRILILNGPPNSGKDTLADNLIKTDCEEWYKASFKTVLYEQTADYYHMDVDRFITIASNRVLKEMSYPELDFKSPRQAMIHVSENITKPEHGNDYYGLAMVDQICGLMSRYDAHNIIIADGDSRI